MKIVEIASVSLNDKLTKRAWLQIAILLTDVEIRSRSNNCSILINIGINVY